MGIINKNNILLFFIFVLFGLPNVQATELSKGSNANVIEISQDPTAVPLSPTNHTPQVVKYNFKIKEVNAPIENGASFPFWTFNGKVPGPFLRVKEGDTLEITLENPKESSFNHTIDFHAATGTGGGAADLMVAPGNTKTIRFKAKQAGLYIYHCAVAHIPTHISHGLYGLILVEPKNGLPQVDKEFYIVQGEMYTKALPKKIQGLHEQDDQRMFDELPTFVVFNGRVGALTGERALKAKVGDTVRIFMGNAGPNEISSFHVIGEIFDRVYNLGDLIDPPLRNVQSIAIPAGGAAMVEFKVDVPGKYTLVDHSLVRAVNKGAMGTLEVTGKPNPEIYAGKIAEKITNPEAKPSADSMH